MPNQKRSNNISLTRPTKKNNNNNLDNDQQEVLQWVELGSNKTSWVWKHFGVKTDGRAY